MMQKLKKMLLIHSQKPVNRKGFVIIVTFFLISGLSSYSQEGDKFNVLFIISDDLTTTAVSSYENTACYTPNIDRLASEGMRYTRAYCQFPVCGPSRASMMFGYYPNATESYGYVSGREIVGHEKKSWAQLFKDNGYYTARVSKIYHMGVPGDIEKGSDGADDEESWTERFNSQGPEWKAAGEAELVQNNPFGSLPRQGGNVMTIVQADGDDFVHSDGKTALKACELIRKHKDKPFFLAVGFVRPHVPFVAPKKYFDLYPYQQMVLPPIVAKDWDDIPERGINYVTSVKARMTEEQEKKAVAGYYATVTYMDAQVGMVLKTIEEEGLENNTIVIFTSDHGFHLGEHRFWMKVGLHEESARVPLIIKVPGKNPGVCHSFAELLDLYPTIADLTGMKPVNQIQGKSLVKTLDEPDFIVRDIAFSSSYSSFLLRDKKWAFIQYGEKEDSGKELYDMEYDSKQYNNLAMNPIYEQVVKDFQEKLKVKLEEVRKNDLGIDYTRKSISDDK
jgi:iduronate 2-sulfatase